MKQKKIQNIKQQKIYRRRRTTLVVALILLVALVVAIYASTNPKTKTANNDSLININGGTIDISKITSEEPNPPVVGAGMIPIKWDENASAWVITTVDDEDWYDYSTGKWANVMLSDGYYKSELERGISEEQLAQNNVGVSIATDPNADIHTRNNIHMDTKTLLQ